MPHLSDQRIRFLVVGGYNTAFSYGFFALIYWLLGPHLHYVWLVVVAHFIAVSHSYATQRWFVFRSQAPWLNEFLRFHIICLTLLPLGVGLLYIFYDIYDLPMLIAQAFALSVSVCLSYLSGKHFTFRPRQR